MEFVTRIYDGEEFAICGAQLSFGGGAGSGSVTNNVVLVVCFALFQDCGHVVVRIIGVDGEGAVKVWKSQNGVRGEVVLKTFKGLLTRMVPYPSCVFFE